MSTIEQKVMASVGAIYIARQLTSTTALKLYVAVISLWGLARLVWVERVFENLSQAGVGGAFNLFLDAILTTDILVQLTLAALVVAGAWFIRDLTHVSGRSPTRFA